MMPCDSCGRRQSDDSQSWKTSDRSAIWLSKRIRTPHWEALAPLRQIASTPIGSGDGLMCSPEPSLLDRIPLCERLTAGVPETGSRRVELKG